MASKGKERENFFRICILVVDHIKDALVDMFKYYLRKYKKNMSFEKFIDEHIKDIRYLKRSKILYKDEVDKLIVDDKAISGLTLDKLEVTLVRRLLDNLCPDLFMDENCKTLQDFLKKNQHDIYHLFKFNEQCCQCSQDYKFPVTSQLLQEDQYKEMFNLTPCTNCAGTSGTVCSVSSCIAKEYIRLNYRIRCQIFEYSSSIFKVMQKLKNLRDKVYGHIVAGVIRNELYGEYKQDIEKNIMVLAKICGNEDKTRLALDDVQKRPCDETLCIQYMISLTEQVKRDQEVMEGIGENRQILQGNSQILQENSQILQKIPRKLQELTEQVGNLKTTEINLTKDQQIMKARLMEKTLADIDILHKEDTFVKTAVVTKGLSCLEEKGFIVLVGIKGSGKSRNSLELLRRYKKQDYHVIMLDDLIEFKQVMNINDKCIVVIDDVFGKTNCKFNEELHSNSLDYVMTCIGKGQIKVVFTMRHSIKSSCKNIICRHRLFKDANFLDLNSDEFAMTVSEKEECLRQYCRYNHIDVLSSPSTLLNSEPETDSGLSVTFESIKSIALLGDNPCLGYPEICFLFTSNSMFTRRGISFFKHPINFLCEDIMNMRWEGQTNERSRLQYTILVYILLSHSNLINSFDLDLQAIDLTMTNIFGTSQKSTLAVTKDCLKSLNGCYLHEDHHGVITFQHLIIVESILMSCSDIDHGIIIPYLDFDFILEMVQPVGRKIAEGEIVFQVPKKSLKILAERLLSILKKKYKVYPRKFMEKLCTSKFISLMGKDFIIDLCEEYINSDCDDYILQNRMRSGHFDSENVHKCDNHSHLLEKILSYENLSMDQCSGEHFFLPTEFLGYSDIYKNDDELLKNLLKIIKTIIQGRYHAYSKKACRRRLMVALLEACKIGNEHQLSMIWQTVLENHICLNLNDKLWSCYEAQIWKLFFEKIDIYFVNDIDDILDCALAEGNVEFIKWILCKFEYRTQAFDINKVLVKAYGIGNVDLVKLVCRIIGMVIVDRSLLKTAMLRACKEKTSKNWELVVWTLENWPHCLFDMNKVMHYAFACKSVENVLWLLDKRSDCCVFNLNDILKISCIDGNLTLVKRLLEKYDRSKFNIKDVIVEGYLFGCEELNQWLFDEFSPEFGEDLFFRCQSEKIKSGKLAQSDGKDGERYLDSGDLVKKVFSETNRNDNDTLNSQYKSLLSCMIFELSNLEITEAWWGDVPYESMHNRSSDDDKIMSMVNDLNTCLDKYFNDESMPPPDVDFNLIIKTECSRDFINYLSFHCHLDMYKNKVDITEGMNFACLRGKLGMVMKLFDGFQIEKFNSKSAFVEAYKSGNFELVSWLLTTLDGNKYEMKSLLDHIYATGVCSIDLFDFLLAKFGDDLFEWNTVMKSSIKGRNFQLVKRLFDKYYNKFDINEIILVACKENVDISTWLLKKFGKETFDMDLIFTEVSGSGSCRLLHYLLNNFGHDCFNIMKAMNFACKNGEIMSVSLLLKTFKDCQLKLFDYHTAMTNACSSGRLDVFCLLRDNVDSSHFDTKRIMNDTCESGNIDSVKFLFQNFNAENFEIPSAFCAACRSGNCELVEWFIESFKLDTDDVREGIREACVWSNTDVVKALMVVSPGSVDHVSLLREATDLNLITNILSTLDHGYYDTETDVYKACASKNHGKLKRLLKSLELDMFDMEIAEKIARLSQDNLLLCMLEKFKRGPDTMNLRNLLWIIVLPVVVLSIVLAVYFGLH